MRPVWFALLLGASLVSPAISQYIRGPRGGCYVITQSGAKRYVDRSLCESTSTPPAALGGSVGRQEGGPAKILHARISGAEGQCFELYRDGTWAAVRESLCESQSRRATVSSGSGRQSKTPSSSGVLRDGSSPYMTGPRGGCYTITSSGRKRYVPRSYCQ